jgi:subfamily B ATP-binding cassette protein MsbA
MDLDTQVTGRQSAWSSYKRLLSYVASYWVVFVVAILGFALFAASQAAFVELTKHMVESVEQNNLEARYIVPVLVILIFLLRGIGFFLGNYGIAYVARHVVHDLRVAIFDKLLVLPAAYYHRHASGTLLSKLTFNVEQITGAATDALKILVREGLTIIGLFAYLLYLNWQLTLAFLLVGPFIGLVVSKAAKRFRTISGNLQDSMGDVTASASETIKGYDVVRVFGGQAKERQRFFKASNGNRQQAMKLALAESISTPVVQMLVAVAMALLIFLALQPEIIAVMTAGEFIAFIIAAGMLTKPLRSLTEVNSILQQGIAAAESIFSLLDETPEPDDSQQQLLQPKGDITFQQLGFAYQDKPILEDIELTLPAGKVVALVGRSGSGKSTLVNLLLRFYDPQSGQICIGGQDISQVKRADLRAQIALVNQQVTLFNGTIAENIAYGAKADAPLEAIEAAAKAARVDEFTDQMHAGLHTQIGESGVLLSGGQRQRIALARALLKDAPILVLDEATSALDTESERHIQEALDELMTDRTTLVIAHRLSTIEQADLIVVMDNGQIMEQGSHQELLEKQGLYSKLQKMQFQNHS